jgi:molecular chaperone HtpG
MTINVPGIIRTLGESLYSDPNVSVRELIQNANDTCIVRQAEEGTNAPPLEIHIRYDPYKRILVVEDNGTGMTAEEVKKFLTVIGSSHTDEVRRHLEEMGESNMAERLIGRFGLGLLSAFIIGEKIEFVTRSYKEGAEAIWWECAGEQEYQMGLGNKATPGTIVTVSIKPKHVGMLKEDKLTELIHLFADLLTVPIYLDPIPRPVNVMSAPWHREATEKEYRDYLTERYPNESILAIIPINIEEDNGAFKVGGALFVPKQPYFIVREHGDVIVYVRRMYVCRDERALLPDWAKFVKGVIESPNLHETTSREAIRRDENFERVRKTLGSAILDYLTRVSEQDPRLFREIVTNHNLVIKAWAIVSDELFDRIKDIVLFTTDAGQMNLKRYFEVSSYSKVAKAAGPNGEKRYIFYFSTPGGVGQHAMLFAAKGLRVIDAQHFPDEPFLQKYRDKHTDVELRRLDVGGEFIFEEL